MANPIDPALAGKLRRESEQTKGRRLDHPDHTVCRDVTRTHARLHACTTHEPDSLTCPPGATFEKGVPIERATGTPWAEMRRSTPRCA